MVLLGYFDVVGKGVIEAAFVGGRHLFISQKIAEKLGFVSPWMVVIAEPFQKPTDLSARCRSLQRAVGQTGTGITSARVVEVGDTELIVVSKRRQLALQFEAAVVAEADKGGDMNGGGVDVRCIGIAVVDRDL